MPALSRMQAESVLRAARGTRPLYDELRPAYVRLDPLVALLRRRGFSGLLHASGQPGEGVVWFDHGRLHSAWLLPAEGGEVQVEQQDPLAVLRVLWADTEATVAVRSAAPPVAAGTPAPTRPIVPVVPAPTAPVAALGPTAAAPRRAGRAVPAEAAPVEPRLLAGIPWARLLPEALARVRRHRGTPLARELEAAVNAVLAPDAVLMGREIHGLIPAERAAAALQAIAAGLQRVAGAAFAERLIWTLGRDFACEAAVKRLVAPEGEA